MKKFAHDNIEEEKEDDISAQVDPDVLRSSVVKTIKSLREKKNSFDKRTPESGDEARNAAAIDALYSNLSGMMQPGLLGGDNRETPREVETNSGDAQERKPLGNGNKIVKVKRKFLSKGSLDVENAGPEASPNQILADKSNQNELRSKIHHLSLVRNEEQSLKKKGLASLKNSQVVVVNELPQISHSSLIQYMVDKSKPLKLMIEEKGGEKGVIDRQLFKTAHFRIALDHLIRKLTAEGELQADLKSMNKKVFSKIEKFLMDKMEQDKTLKTATSSHLEKANFIMRRFDERIKEIQRSIEVSLNLNF